MGGEGGRVLPGFVGFVAGAHVACDAPPTSAIEEPASAEANPMARSRAEASERAATDAFEGSSSHPREREKVETVEGRVMTKKMLRELAARRGLSYTDMLAQARASGVDLPDE